MTDVLKELRELEPLVTPAPWLKDQTGTTDRVYSDNEFTIQGWKKTVCSKTRGGQADIDLKFISLSRNAMPVLLRMIDSQRAVIEDYKGKAEGGS